VKGEGGGRGWEGLKAVARSVADRMAGMRDGWRVGEEMMNMEPERRGEKGWRSGSGWL